MVEIVGFEQQPISHDFFKHINKKDDEVLFR